MTDHIHRQNVLEPITLLLSVVLNTVLKWRKTLIPPATKSFDLLASVSQNYVTQLNQ